MATQEAFIERATEYQLKHAQLNVYETNVPCAGIKFYFKSNTITVMLSGHKTVTSPTHKVEFFPGTVFIPEKDVEQIVDIPNASFQNSTKCLVLEIDPIFLKRYTEKLLSEDDKGWLRTKGEQQVFQPHFMGNDPIMIECFKRLYEYQLLPDSATKEEISCLVLKELILRLYETDAYYLLFENFAVADSEALSKAMLFIKSNVHRSIKIEELVETTGIGKTSLFESFKSSTGMTPVRYIMTERVAMAKSIMNSAHSLKQVAYNCGFNTYEHFCKTFKKFEKVTPKEYRKLHSTSF